MTHICFEKPPGALSFVHVVDVAVGLFVLALLQGGSWKIKA